MARSYHSTASRVMRTGLGGTITHRPQGTRSIPLPLKHKERDCTEDIGCDEFYGKEEVSVTGMGDVYTAQIYNNKLM